MLILSQNGDPVEMCHSDFISTNVVGFGCNYNINLHPVPFGRTNGLVVVGGQTVWSVGTGLASWLAAACIGE